MKRFGITMLLAAATMAAAPNVFGQEDLARSLGGLIFAADWKASEAPAVYDAKNLFELINGEAELYFPYGFKRTIAVTYASAPETGGKISVEVYELGTPLDAFGVYSNYRDERSRLEPFGAEGFMGTTQVLFFQDRFFVKIRLGGKTANGREALRSCAEAVSRVLPPNKEMPEEVKLLRFTGVIPQTTRYVAQSVLGYDFFTMGLTAGAVVATKPVTLFVVLGMSPKDAGDTLNRYIAHLEQNNGRYRWEELPEGRTLLAVDPLYKGVLAASVGNYVIGVAKLATPKEGLPMLAQFREAVAARP
ncbi:MAG TPA: hypothetical protein PK967_17190 [Candidatus Hydrogenedentes bacterium]|nr:hypothetical protein [Candidatus Hydrogenedentota bacterium]